MSNFESRLDIGRRPQPPVGFNAVLTGSIERLIGAFEADRLAARRTNQQRATPYQLGGIDQFNDAHLSLLIGHDHYLRSEDLTENRQHLESARRRAALH